MNAMFFTGEAAFGLTCSEETSELTILVKASGTLYVEPVEFTETASERLAESL